MASRRRLRLRLRLQLRPNRALGYEAIRSAVLLCCTVAVITSCSHSSIPAQSNSAPGSRADDMIVSIEDVRRIANTDDLSPHAEADLRKPPPADANAPGPCRPVGHNDLTFGNGWSEFRSAGYHGVTDDTSPGANAIVNGVTQAVARYPNPDAALSAFHQLETALQACNNLHDPNYEFILDKPDPSTLRITADEWSHLYRTKSAVMVSVGVVGLQTADQIAGTVLRMVTDRIR
ncbi:MAG: sensor domain-containing protein [Mycobacterium sp.]|uniref:sensor domain-containing protein n=1 Tax=Mycobacterium sp. TaxID=1785 RepID=UPI003F9D8553